MMYICYSIIWEWLHSTFNVIWYRLTHTISGLFITWYLLYLLVFGVLSSIINLSCFNFIARVFYGFTITFVRWKPWEDMWQITINCLQKLDHEAVGWMDASSEYHKTNHRERFWNYARLITMYEQQKGTALKW